MKNKGFSLVELIVVIAIMAILVGVAVPVYSSYIEKTQKSKDEQMIDEIKHAIEIAAVGDSWYQEIPGGGAVGTIVISDNGTTVSGDNATLIQTALEKTFGDLTSLKLSYDGWTGTLNADGVAVLKSSAFSADTGELLDTVQDVTDLFSKYVKEYGDSLTFDEDFFSELGVDASNPKQNSQAVANGMVVYVADQTKKLPVDTLIAAWKTINFTGFETDELDTFGQKAFEYAYVQAMVSRFQCNDAETGLTTEFGNYNSAYSGAHPYSAVFEPHLDKCTSCDTKYSEYMSDEAAMTNDAKAYHTLITQVSSSRDLVASNVNSDKMYSDSALGQYVESYVAIADLVSSSKAKDGDVVIVVVMDAAGQLMLNIYPLEY